MRLPLLDRKIRTSIDYDLLYKMVDEYMESGFSYFDTAYQYHNGESENAFKKAVVDRYDRDKFEIADKMPMLIVKKHEQLHEIFEEQLKKCGVSYFDYYLLHAVGDSNYKTIKELDAFGFLREKKQQGIVKKIGFSFHAGAGLLDEILKKYVYVDFVQLQINYLDWEDVTIESRKCYEIARKHGKQIMVMEPVKGGVLANIPEEAETLFKEYSPNSSIASWAIRYAASQEGVVNVLSGMSDFEQVRDNISYMKDFIPLCEEEYKIIEQAKKCILKNVVVPCTSCYYCTKNCPRQIKIPEYFAIFNNMKQFEARQKAVTSMYYSNLFTSSGKIEECLKCGKCEQACPQHIPIIAKLKEVDYELKKKSFLMMRAAYKKTRNKKLY